MRIVLTFLMASVLATAAAAQETVTFPTEDGAVVEADLYGSGPHAVLLAHGGRFDKESWADQVPMLVAAGYRVAAINFRGYGASTRPGGVTDRYQGLHHDVLAAVRYLRERGAEEVSVVGGSMGGTAAAEASVASEPGEIDRLILLAPGSIERPERMKGRKLFIVARDDPQGSGAPRLPGIRDQYDRAPEPKELVILDGDAHAQWIFETDQGDALMREILEFLETP